MTFFLNKNMSNDAFLPHADNIGESLSVTTNRKNSGITGHAWLPLDIKVFNAPM
jgi:hypothetical protein